MKPPTEPIVNEKPIIPVPETVLARALKRMQMVCKGNGIKAEQIALKENRAQIFAFPAKTLIRLTPIINTKTVAGKIMKGEMISSPSEFQVALQKVMIDAKTNGATRKKIIDTVLKRPDKGFAARDQKFLVPDLAREFVAHEQCGACNGKGKNTCHACSGKGTSLCATCQGRCTILCPNCRGSGHVMVNGTRTVCARCNSNGRITCPSCGGRGQVACNTCKGTQEIKCAKCSGTGSLSHIATLNVDAALHFDYERQGLPLSVGKRIDAFGMRFAAQKDFLIEAHDSTLISEEPSPSQEDGILSIDYLCKIPHGDVIFELKNKPIRATLFGYRADIIETDTPFLQLLTRPAQNALKAASNSPAETAKGLIFAAKFRLFKDIIALASLSGSGRGATQNSVSKLLQKYPFGISGDYLLETFMDAQNALKILSHRPSLIGALSGFLISVLLLAFYFFGQGRPWISEIFLHNIIHPYWIFGIDFLSFILTLFIIKTSASLCAVHSVKKTLGGILNLTKNPNAFPLPNSIKLLCTLGGGALFLIAYIFAFYLEKLPEVNALISTGL